MENTNKYYITLKEIEKEYNLEKRAALEIAKQNDVKIISGGQGKMYRFSKKDWINLMEK